jgi:hypothetical protein
LSAVEHSAQGGGHELVGVGVAVGEECDHAGRGLRPVEVDHQGVEFVGSLGWHADGVDAVAHHQMSVHHVPRRAFVPVEVELLQCAEQKVGRCLLVRRR